MNKIKFNKFDGVPSRGGYDKSRWVYIHSKIFGLELIEKEIDVFLNIGDYVTIDQFTTRVENRLYDVNNKCFIYLYKEVYTGRRE